MIQPAQQVADLPNNFAALRKPNLRSVLVIFVGISQAVFARLLKCPESHRDQLRKDDANRRPRAAAPRYPAQETRHPPGSLRFMRDVSRHTLTNPGNVLAPRTTPAQSAVEHEHTDPTRAMQIPGSPSPDPVHVAQISNLPSPLPVSPRTQPPRDESASLSRRKTR